MPAVVPWLPHGILASVQIVRIYDIRLVEHDRRCDTDSAAERKKKN